MPIKRLTENELLKGLDAHTAHSDELAAPMPQELAPPDRLEGSAQRFGRPTDQVCEEYFDSEGVSDDFMKDRDQHHGQR